LVGRGSLPLRRHPGSLCQSDSDGMAVRDSFRKDDNWLLIPCASLDKVTELTPGLTDLRPPGMAQIPAYSPELFLDQARRNQQIGIFRHRFCRAAGAEKLA